MSLMPAVPGLTFGLEIALADGADHVDAVTLARLAEDLGFGIIVFPDADNEAARTAADAWSLASWTAAGTTSAIIAAELPLTDRPAFTMARAGASLQLLSGNRATLILRGGSTAGELQTLHEAVGVLRAMEDSAGTRVSHPGESHRVERAEPGPVVDRGVPVWIRGGSREIVSAAGQVADGWLASLIDLTADALAELSDTLDDAATAAGRDPREVRRGVVLGEADPTAVGDLNSLGATLGHLGVSVVVLRVVASADAQSRVRRFIDTTAPAIQTGVERVLPQGFPARQIRRADVRARRRPAIDYDGVPHDLLETAVEPGDPAFGRVRSTYMRGGDPGLVLRPREAAEVASAIGFAHRHSHLPLGIRSGGHGISGRSTNDGGLVIDVGALNGITVLDASRRLVRFGPGARWRDVATALQPHGWALSSGDYGGVGVGGLATTGGIGFLNRKHGLTIDSLRAVEMVLADGTLVRASDSENPELFWAVRGAGANFGIAVGFEFEAHEVGDVGWAQLAFQAPDTAAYLEAFGKVAMDAPRETTPFLIVGQGMAQIMAMVDSADPDVVIGQLQPFAEIAPMVQQQVLIAPTRR